MIPREIHDQAAEWKRQADVLSRSLDVATDALTEFASGCHGDIAALDAQQALDRIAGLSS